MSITIVDSILTEGEIEFLHQTIAKSDTVVNNELGRLQVNDIKNGLTEETIERLSKIAKDIAETHLEVGSAVYVEYNSLYGKPTLPPHLDGDTNDLILNIQLESNTTWAIGLNFETYEIEDNSALVFNPNKEIHWRVHKEFRDGEYVKMLFVRLLKPKDRSDYSYLDLRQNDEMFRETVEFRESLGIF